MAERRSIPTTLPPAPIRVSSRMREKGCMSRARAEREEPLSCHAQRFRLMPGNAQQPCVAKVTIDLAFSKQNQGCFKSEV